MGSTRPRLALLALVITAAACQPPEDAALPEEGESELAVGGRKPDLNPPSGVEGTPDLNVTPKPPAVEPPLPPLVKPNNPTPPPQANYPEPLQYTLSQPLKSPNCAYDGDRDCLNDNMERELATTMNPIQFWDSQESCPDRKSYYQVRPVGRASTLFPGVESTTEFVDRWSSGEGTYYVTINFMMWFFKDCNTKVLVSFQGHQGDGEQVTFLLSSRDLRTWKVEKASYAAHGNDAKYDRQDLLPIAWALNGHHLHTRQVAPWVATDEDGHGSFPGVSPRSSACSREPDPYGIRDCFKDNLINDYAHGETGKVLADGELDNNIGEPDAWNQKIIKTSPDGRDAWVDFNGQRESLSDPNKPFCGWRCSERNVAGSCIFRGPPPNNFVVVARCTSPLFRSVSQSCYRIGTQIIGNCW